MSDNTSFRFDPVSPPAKVPVDGVAATLGLVDGLRAETSRSQYRCAACHKWQRGGSWLVWVPDSVDRRDPAWVVAEECRRNAYNGCASGWCLSCARGLTPGLVRARRAFASLWGRFR